MIGIIAKILTGGLTGQILEAWKLYREGKTTEAEFEAKVQVASKEAEARMEEAWSKSASEMMESIQTTVRSSKELQRAFVLVLFSQLFVLVWYQLGTSAYEIISGSRWPAPVASIEWAYLLIAAMIGAGPWVFRKGK